MMGRRNGGFLARQRSPLGRSGPPGRARAAGLRTELAGVRARSRRVPPAPADGRDHRREAVVRASACSPGMQARGARASVRRHPQWRQPGSQTFGVPVAVARTQSIPRRAESRTSSGDPPQPRDPRPRPRTPACPTVHGARLRVRPVPALCRAGGRAENGPRHDGRRGHSPRGQAAAQGSPNRR